MKILKVMNIKIAAKPYFLNAFMLVVAVIAFALNAVPYGAIFGLPIYLLNLMLIGVRYDQLDPTDRQIMVWLPLSPIGVMVLIGLLTAIH